MKLITAPDKRLAQRAAPVVFEGPGRTSPPELGRLIMGMLDTMYLHDGIGLAAPQIGVNKQIIVVDPLGDRHQAKVLINPEIWWLSERMTLGPEGCLSIPGTFGQVERHESIRVRYRGRDGLLRDLEADDLLARVIQHECDHLAGVLFTDKMVPPLP